MLKTTFYLTVWSLLFCFISTSNCNGALLVWNANSEDDLAGYIVYYTAVDKRYFSFVDVGNVTEVQLEDINISEGYNYIAITAYDTSGNESAFSTIVQHFADDNIGIGDNCPSKYNPSQKDTYPPGGNGVGDACECEGDFNNNGSLDAEDISLFKKDTGRNLWDNPCTNANPCYGDFDCNGSVDATDIKLFMEDLGRNIHNNPCPYHKVEGWCDY